jgi:large subunit ribosomal protein L23
MAKTILIRPIITEKADLLSERLQKYSFVVDRRANKLEIARAVEERYSVNVESVNTMVMPGKQKNRMTRTGILEGRLPSYKKAVVTLYEGEEIDLFGDI